MLIALVVGAASFFLLFYKAKGSKKMRDPVTLQDPNLKYPLRLIDREVSCLYLGLCKIRFDIVFLNCSLIIMHRPEELLSFLSHATTEVNQMPIKDSVCFTLFLIAGPF